MAEYLLMTLVDEDWQIDVKTTRDNATILEYRNKKTKLFFRRKAYHPDKLLDYYDELPNM